MERIKVESSNLKSIGYDADTSVMEVEFIKGGVYRYLGVPKEVYDGIMQAESKGKAFNAVKYSYAFEKVETPGPDVAQS